MDKSSFVMYTQPITITVIDPDAETEAGIETTATPAPDETPTTDSVDPTETDEETLPMTDDADSDSVEQTTVEKPPFSESPSEKGCHSTVSGAIGILTVLAAVVACLTTARRRRL